MNRTRVLGTDAFPLIVAGLARHDGTTGVHTHVRQLRHYLGSHGLGAELVTPHDWAARSRLRQSVQLPLFGVRPALERLSGPAHVRWYRRSHEEFLRMALREVLPAMGPCVVYAQCPLSARAAMDARVGPHQRVVLTVHFRISQADEWADKDLIQRGGATYHSIRQTEREVLTAVDGLVFVSEWARSAVLGWLPEAAGMRSTVVNNFVRRPPSAESVARWGDLVSIGSLERVKNHRFLLSVLAAAADLGHRYTLDVYGEGVERRSLLGLADGLGVADLFRLHGFRRDVVGRLPGYRAYVHASYSDSSSLAIMEAMASGLPIVTSTEGALNELIHDPEHGRFWPIDDAGEAARILVDLLESPRLADTGRAARAKFEQDYDAERVVPRLLSFLEETSG